jgi:hypothetical protein
MSSECIWKNEVISHAAHGKDMSAMTCPTVSHAIHLKGCKEKGWLKKPGVAAISSAMRIDVDF